MILDPRKGIKLAVNFSHSGRKEDGLNFGILCQMFSWQNCARGEI